MSSITDKVKALLAKADSSEHEPERLAFYAKAHELIVKHAIDQADLADSDVDKDKIIKIVIPRTPKRADDYLYHYICINNSVKYVRAGSPRDGGRVAWLIGYETDIQFCQALFTSLLLYRESECASAWMGHTGGVHGKEWKHSFRMAFASRIYQRLQDFNRKTNETFGNSGALVIIDRKRQVERFSRATIGRTAKSAGTRSSAAAHTEGRAAADRANVSGGSRNLANRKALT